MRVGQLDADLRGELPGELLVPLVVVGEEAFGVDVDLGHTDGGDGHGCFSSAGWCVPAAAGASTSTGRRACPSGCAGSRSAARTGRPSAAGRFRSTVRCL